MSNAVCETLTVGCAVGCAQSGRTAYLLRRAGELAAGQGRVAYVCARSADADRVRTRLAQAGVSAGAVEVTTARELALEVLATPQGREMFHRAPRVLEPYEQDILLEDLKVSQMRNRRLRQVLTYLYAGWENLSDESWEQTPEEDLVIARLQDNLRFYGGVLACEAANLALKAVRASEDVRATCRRDHILVDDYELLNRASQHLVRALAGASLTVAGALRPGLAGDDEHPCYAGIDELVAAFPGAHVELLGESCQSDQVKGVLEKLSVDEALEPIVEAAPLKAAAACGADGARPGRAEAADGAGDAATQACAGALRVEPSLERELQALAEVSAAALGRGQDVMIVGTDRLWRRNVAANLARVGLPVRKPPASTPRLRDFHDERACARVRRDALERLVRDPQDELAWRSMIALGDAVGRSAAVDRLRQWACGAGQPAMGLHDALEQLSAGNVEADELAAPLLSDLREAYLNARGQLYAHIGAQMASRDGAAGESGADDAEGQGAPGILVCSPEQASGRRAGTVIFGGFVNGLIPCRAYFDPAGLAGNARIRERRQAARRVFGAASCARDEVLFTAFSSASLQAAETMDAHIASIKLRRGLRTAIIEPSIFADLLA